MKIKLERIARSRKLNGSSELMRIAAMDIIFEVEEMLNCLQMPIDLTTVTEDTRNTSDFELMPSPPLRDVTPKHTGTKKAQLSQPEAPNAAGVAQPKKRIPVLTEKGWSTKEAD